MPSRVAHVSVCCVCGVQGEGTAERDVKLIQEALKDATDASVRTPTPITANTYHTYPSEMLQ